MTIKRVSPKEAFELMQNDGYVYVDVRSIPEFDMGHATGAFNVPLMHMGAQGMEPNADFLSVMKKAFPQDKKLVVGCQAGGRSLRAAQLLIDAGFTNVIDQRAGWKGQSDPFGRVTEKGWSGEGLPTSTSPEAGRDYAGLSKS